MLRTRKRAHYSSESIESAASGLSIYKCRGTCFWRVFCGAAPAVSWCHEISVGSTSARIQKYILDSGEIESTASEISLGGFRALPLKSQSRALHCTCIGDARIAVLQFALSRTHCDFWEGL